MMAHDPHDLVQRKEGVAPDLRGYVLSFSAESQQLDEIEMVGEVSNVVTLLHTHELQKSAEGLVVVEQEDVISRIS